LEEFGESEKSGESQKSGESDERKVSGQREARLGRALSCAKSMPAVVVNPMALLELNSDVSSQRWCYIWRITALSMLPSECRTVVVVVGEELSKGAPNEFIYGRKEMRGAASAFASSALRNVLIAVCFPCYVFYAVCCLLHLPSSLFAVLSAVR
jgi:hypothetical protein